MPRKLPRPAIQRAFLAWHEEAAARLAVPVLLGHRTDRRWTLSFGGGITAALHPWLYGYGIGVDVQWEGMSWDLVLCLEAAPRRTPTGYVDHMILPEYREPYATEEALWRGQLFEPFLSWVNETLAPARYLGIWGARGEVIFARLLRPEDMTRPDVPKAYALLPARDEAETRSASVAHV